MIQSELDLSIDKVECLIVADLLRVGVRPARVEPLDLPEHPQHIAHPKTQNQGGGDKPENGESHGNIGDKSRHLIPHIKILLVVDVIGRVLEHQVIEGTPTAQEVHAL